MKLKAKYDSLDDVPEKFRELYEEQDDGTAVLVGVEGVKTQSDVDRAMESLRKEREAHKATKAKYKAFEGIDPEEVTRLRDQVEDLTAQLDVVGDGKLDEKKLQDLAEKRAEKIVVQKTREFERSLKAKDKEIATMSTELGEFRGEAKRRKITSQAHEPTKGDKGVKLRTEALEDWEMVVERIFDLDEAGKAVTREGAALGSLQFEPGLDPRAVLEEIQRAGVRKHWFPESKPAGAREGGGGGGGVNPFAGKEPNLTEISTLVRKDPARAKRLASAAERLDLLPPELRRD